MKKKKIPDYNREAFTNMLIAGENIVRSLSIAVRGYSFSTVDFRQSLYDAGNRQPSTLTLDKLRKGITESWEEQRKLFLS